MTENNEESSCDFDWGALDNSPLFEGEFGECLKDAVNNYVNRKLFQMLIIFNEMSSEERIALAGWAVEGKSFREIGREINRDHKTAQMRCYDAINKIRNSPLVKVHFKRKRKEN
ncbi:MAG: helix-turn-helix domain-containing protein [Victivallaceae bacterium]|nr:helix-turn-helix domain-containing protein [Victivallaceae bacterium]